MEISFGRKAPGAAHAPRHGALRPPTSLERASQSFFHAFALRLGLRPSEAARQRHTPSALPFVHAVAPRAGSLFAGQRESPVPSIWGTEEPCWLQTQKSGSRWLERQEHSSDSPLRMTRRNCPTGEECQHTIMMASHLHSLSSQGIPATFRKRYTHLTQINTVCITGRNHIWRVFLESDKHYPDLERFSSLASWRKECPHSFSCAPYPESEHHTTLVWPASHSARTELCPIPACLLRLSAQS